jgi:hypothetical protein
LIKDDPDEMAQPIHNQRPTDLQHIADHAHNPVPPQLRLFRQQPAASPLPSNVSICCASKRFLLRLVMPKPCFSPLNALSTQYRTE